MLMNIGNVTQISILISFDGNIRLDESWREKLSSEDQSIALAAAGDFAARQGYV